MTKIEQLAKVLIDHACQRYQIQSLDEFTCPIYKALAIQIYPDGLPELTKEKLAPSQYLEKIGVIINW